SRRRAAVSISSASVNGVWAIGSTPRSTRGTGPPPFGTVRAATVRERLTWLRSLTVAARTIALHGLPIPHATVTVEHPLRLTWLRSLTVAARTIALHGLPIPHATV